MKHISRILITLLLVAYTNICWGETYTDTIKAYITKSAPVIDGLSTDACWTTAAWHPIDQLYQGSKPAAADFKGQYKVVWDKDYLYLLVEIVDDSLFDVHPNPFSDYWKGDVVEIFLDENRSKGNHQYNYNAFAYHVSPSYKVIDLGTDQKQLYLNDNLTVKMDTVENDKYSWEFAVKIYTGTFKPSDPEASRRELAANNIMGLTLAYCDNDGNNSRESFMGSIKIPTTEDVNWVKADYFGLLYLIDPDYKPSAVKNASKISNEISFFPNPAKDFITIQLNNKPASEIKIYNITGKLVKKQLLVAGENAGSVNVKDLNRGLYFLEISNNGAILSTKKLILE